MTEALESTDLNSTGVDGSSDPFSPENIGIVHFITQARIYDALMSILAVLDADKADQLLEVHSTGGIVGPEPRFSGVFVSDEVNP